MEFEYTNEYELGWESFAEKSKFKITHKNNYVVYELPGTYENGWIIELHPADGLFVASAWMTTDIELNYTFNINKPSLRDFCIDEGELTFTRRGVSPTVLKPFTNIYINPGKFKLTIPAGMHLCFTSILIFDSFIENYLNANKIEYPIKISDASKWKERHIDTPYIMLIMEQIRWGVRGGRIPMPVYSCKAIELLCAFAHNLACEPYKRERRHYVTWDDEQKLYRVHERIDKNPLEAPGIDELCRIAEMSESKLRIAFKSLYKKTLYAYIRETIMKRAMQMLASDELSIKNIANLCGYENAAKFTAAFKDVFGYTPSDFRKGFGL